MYRLCFISAFTSDGQLWFSNRQLSQQLRRHRCIADVVGGDADGSHLQFLGINTYVQLASLTPMFRANFFARLFAFVQKLDARGIEQ